MKRNEFLMRSAGRRLMLSGDSMNKTQEIVIGNGTAGSRQALA
jgi:hypothetical protein